MNNVSKEFNLGSIL